MANIDVKKLTTGSRLKIQRANSHIDEFRRRTEPLDPGLYEITYREARGPFIYVKPPTQYQLAYRPKEEIPEAFALIIGDVFTNLRAALDQLAKKIVVTWGTNVDTKKPVYFPAAPRKDLPAHSSLATIEQALPGFAKLLLDQIRPVNGGNDHLWQFATLSNDDKHSDILPTVTMAEIRMTARTGTNVLSNAGFGCDAARPQGLMVSDLPITVDDGFKVTVDVKFGKGTAFENQPVLPTLTQISEVVSETLNACENLIVAKLA